MAWLLTDAIIPAPARYGADPGAMFTPSSSMTLAAVIIWSTIASEAFRVLRFANAIASSISTRSRSMG